MTHKGDDLFRGCLMGVDDVSDKDASIIFDKAHRLLNQVDFIPVINFTFAFISFCLISLLSP